MGKSTGTNRRHGDPKKTGLHRQALPEAGDENRSVQTPKTESGPGGLQRLWLSPRIKSGFLICETPVTHPPQSSISQKCEGAEGWLEFGLFVDWNPEKNPYNWKEFRAEMEAARERAQHESARPEDCRISVFGRIAEVERTFYIDEGELLFRDDGEGFRNGLLNMAKNALFIIADNVGTMQCEGFLVNQGAIKAATQKLYEEILKEFGYRVEKTGDDGRFDLVLRCPDAPGRMRKGGVSEAYNDNRSFRFWNVDGVHGAGRNQAYKAGRRDRFLFLFKHGRSSYSATPGRVSLFSVPGHDEGCGPEAERRLWGEEAIFHEL